MPRLKTWTAPAAGDLLFEDWDAETAVFDRRTGETHMVSALPAEVLRRLQGCNADLGFLAAQIAADHDLPDDPPWRANVAASLAHLEQIGLIEQADG